MKVPLSLLSLLPDIRVKISHIDDIKRTLWGTEGQRTGSNEGQDRNSRDKRLTWGVLVQERRQGFHAAPANLVQGIRAKV